MKYYAIMVICRNSHIIAHYNSHTQRKKENARFLSQLMLQNLSAWADGLAFIGR